MTPEKYQLGKLEVKVLALKWAICKPFRDYLYHALNFIVYTDNNPLAYILLTKLS